MRKALSTYFLSIVMLIQSYANVTMPYRAIGTLRTLGAMVNPALIFGSLTSTTAAVGLTSSLFPAPVRSEIVSAQAKCPSGFTEYSGTCIKEETAPVKVTCSESGMYATKIYDSVSGLWIDSCKKDITKNAQPICGAGETIGGANNQQCRKEVNPLANGTCPSGTSLNGGKCVTNWYFPSPTKFYCSPLCDIPLNSPNASCPASQDPIANAPKISGECTPQGERDGKCVAGETVTLQMPNLQWLIESPLVPASASNPITCSRSEYGNVQRTCPTPNEATHNPSETVWRFPYGPNAENSAFYDFQSGAVNMCMRRISDKLVRTCPSGMSYDEITSSCKPAVVCPNGGSYVNGQCRNGNDISCPSTHTLDPVTKICTLKPTDNSFNSVYQQGADFGWQLGTLQKDLVQTSDNSGNVDLNMALLSKEANDDLQSRGITNISTSGVAPSTSFADIDDTYGDEKEQTKAIKENAATYTEYLSGAGGSVAMNAPAEAYGVVTNSINNRPPSTSPDDEWLQSSQDMIEGIGTGENPWFGDCTAPNTTKRVLDQSKQIITEENCVRPVTVNYNSCQVKRFIEKPTLKILDGMDSSKIEFINSRTLKVTIGTLCDNCLVQRSGENCSTYEDSVTLQMAADLGIVKATITESSWDDIFVVSTAGQEIFRGGSTPWASSGWPSPQDSCERTTSNNWSGSKNVTDEFRADLGDDNIITFKYKVGVGGKGEAQAVLLLEFDDDVRTEWTSTPVYEPEGCELKLETGMCQADGWECTLQSQKNTLGMENWFEWDSVPNWNIYNDGYAASSTLNGPWSAYGSLGSVGNLHFKGNVIMPDEDDDTVGFIFGYPDAPVWTKDPTSSNYNPNAQDTENNHYYMLLWTGNTDQNGAVQGLSVNKYYVPYTKLESGINSPSWGINFHQDMTLPDPVTGQPKVIVKSLYSDQSFKWRNNQSYAIEFNHSAYGTFEFTVDGVKKVSLDATNEIKTGRFAFTTVSLNKVRFEALEKVPEFNFPALWEGGETNPMCMRGNATNMRCDPLAGQTIADTSGNHWDYEELRQAESTCAPLESNAQCSWIKRECEAKTDKGECLLEREYYNCVDNSQAWKTVPVENSCADILPCADGDESCEVRGKESSPDFSEAITQIGVINEMRNYMDCSDPNDPMSCEVFKGTKRQCSFDQFGLVDCCEEFKGKTVDLFKLANNMMSIASYADSQLDISGNLSNKMFGENGEGGWIPDDLWGVETAVDGAWVTIDETVTNVQTGVTDAWGSLTSTGSEPYASEVDNTAGTIDESPANEDGSLDTDSKFSDFAVDLVKQGVINKLKEMAMDYLMTTVAPIVAEAVGNALVSAGLASSAQGVTAGASAALGAVAAILSFVAIAVAVIQIAMAVYQMLNGCDDEEIDMPQVLKEHKCFFAYKKSCTKKFGICQSKHRNRYCCFSSVLSRIIMEQAVTQPAIFGQSYTKKEWYEEQSCRGLAMNEIPLMDFTQIDYTEWFDLMVQSGALPDNQTTLEEMTVEKSFVNPYGRTDALSLQNDRGLKETNEKYREELDKQDVKSQIDCSKTPNVQSCRTGIFAD